MRCCCSFASSCSRASFLIRVARLRGVEPSMATWLNLRFAHLLSASIFVMPAFGSGLASSPMMRMICRASEFPHFW